MKRSIILSTLVVVGAGIALVNVLPAAHSSTASSEPAQPKPVSVASLAAAPTSAPTTQTGQPLIHKASLDTRQAPVPLLMKPRPAVALPATDAAVASPTDAKAEDAKPADPVVDASAQGAAKAAIEADGYKGVKLLNKGDNGIWHATALRGRTTVSLTVDASGSVSAD
jgi:hypothetical protein